MEKILTVNNVAEILQVKAITVREMFREKRIRGFKVGKAWRTTEAMLREDIDALSRGESPAALAMPGAAAPADPAPAAPPAARKRAVEPNPAPESPASTAAKPRAAKKTPETPEKPDGSDDTQQLLF